MKHLLLIGTVVPLLLLGCGSDSSTASTADDLTGTSWVLASVAIDGVSTAASTDGEAPLTFAEGGGLVGSTGCNRFVGTWTQDGAALTLETGPVTLAGCRSAELQAQEQALLALLPQVATAESTGDALSLLDAGGAVLLGYTAALSDLAGTSWTATGINNQTGGVEGTALTPSVTATFDADGTVSGFSGCREYSGLWESADGSIAVTELTTEGAGCTGEEARLEDQYLAALAAASTVQIEGSTANLRDSDGATQVNYTRADS